MSFTGFHHGTRLAESDETPVLVQLAPSNVVALLGTAPSANATTFPLDTPVLLPGSPAKAADLGADGTLKNAVDAVFDQIGADVVVIRVDEGADLAATQSNLVGDATTLTGVHALKKAQDLVARTPRLIAAPGFTAGDGSAANPVTAELLGILEQLNAVAFVDGPDTTNADALADRALISSQRVYICDPKVKVWNTTTSSYDLRPASAHFAGVQARTDVEHGFWWSLSNKPINGIGGVSRTISYGSQANLLNENGVGTIINRGEGYITFGNRSVTSDSLWKFLSVRRTADMINLGLESAFFEFVDKPFSKANIKFMLESGNDFLRQMQALGAIIGGEVFLEEDQNLPVDLAAGKITFGVQFEPPAPMEDIRFTAHRNIQYYLTLVDGAIQAAA